MIRVTVDTTLLASGFVREETPPGQLLAAWTGGQYTLILSEPILEELARTFTEPYFARRLSPERQAQYLATLRRLAIITPITATVHRVATHPEDDVVLATALSGKAQFLVTTDYRFVSLKAYEGLILVTAHEFLAMLPGLVDQVS